MKNAVSFIFAALLGVVGLSACGGGGGGGTAAAISTYIPITYPDMQNLLDAQNALNAQNNTNVVLTLSPNRITATPGVNLDDDKNRFHLGEYDVVIVSGARAGDALAITTVVSDDGFTDTVTTHFTAFSQDGTLFAAIRCVHPWKDVLCWELRLTTRNLVLSFEEHSPNPRRFNWPSGGSYEVDNIFYFSRGLIENAHAFGNWHVNAENKHAEYRWTPYSDVFVDSGFRRFGNADVVYAKMQADYKNFYLQYTLGNLRSDYYQSGKIDGVAIGWQKDGFAAKAEKPIGNADKAWFRLFYKTDL